MGNVNILVSIIAFLIMIQASEGQLPVWDYCGGNSWMPDESRLYNNQTSFASGIIKCGDTSCMYGTIHGPGILNFAWQKSANTNPAFYVNYSFYINGAKRAQCDNTTWKDVKLPIDSGANEVKWVLTLDSRTPSGCCPNFAQGSAWIADISVIADNNGDDGSGEEFGVEVTPRKGCLNDSYIYNISAGKVLQCSELRLEIKNPQLDSWCCSYEGKINGDNITFQVPSLSFINPPFFGDIEFRFKCGDRTIGPFKGPNIILNILDAVQDPSSRTLSLGVISNLCGRNICLNCDGIIKRRTYDGCGELRTLTFTDLNMSGDDWDIGVCDE